MIDLHVHLPPPSHPLSEPPDPAMAGSPSSQPAVVALGADWQVTCVAPPPDAGPAPDAWLDAALALGDDVRPWAIGSDPDAVTAALARGAVGLALPAAAFAAPGALEALAPVLDRLESAGAPLLVRPTCDPAPSAAGVRWRTTVVDHVAQLHAAWFTWADGGRERFPTLPVVFASLAGLAPLHGERVRAAGGPVRPVDPLTFVETSSYGARAVDAVVRVLGIDVVCFGSGDPAHPPHDLRLDPAAHRAVHDANPQRLLAPALQEVPA